MTRETLSRRDWLRLAGAGAACSSLSGWLGALAASAARDPGRRPCILLWMSGGPSQLDTFDLKPDHKNGAHSGRWPRALPASGSVSTSRRSPDTCGTWRWCAR